MREREDALRAAEVPEAMLPAVDQFNPLRQVLGDEVVSRMREQRAPTVCDRTDPGAPRQRDPEVVALVAELRVGRVQRDAHAQLDPALPLLCVEG